MYSEHISDFKEKMNFKENLAEMLFIVVISADNKILISKNCFSFLQNYMKQVNNSKNQPILLRKFVCSFKLSTKWLLQQCKT